MTSPIDSAFAATAHASDHVTGA